MKKVFSMSLTTASLALLHIASAHAATVYFDCITQNNSANCLTGETQLSVEVVDTGSNQVYFIVKNAGTSASAVEGVYFDDGTLLGISSLTDRDEGVGGLAGVDFTAGSASPPELPGAQQASPVFQTTAGFLADADNPSPAKGINPGEWLGVTFNLQNGGTYYDVINELQSGELRIGVHVQAFDNGGSESFVSNLLPVPLPAAGGLFALALILLSRFTRARRLIPSPLPQ